MSKNPFSIYDFLGYVLPGGVSLLLAYFIYKNHDNNFMMSQDYRNAVLDTIAALKLHGFSSLEFSVVSITASYIIGHLVAFVSSITVERFAIWFYNYPSVFLLSEKPKPRLISDIKSQWKNNVRCSAIGNTLMRLMVLVLLLPLTICNLVIKILNLYVYFIKPLDSFLKESIQLKLTQLEKQLGIAGIKRTKDSDIHRIVYHYVYENYPGHRVKMDNYVALYGVLRSLTFISCLFVIYIWKCQFSFITRNFNWHLMIDYPYLKTFFLVLVQFLFFMAFMKFYRRFTLESFMCMVAMRETEKHESDVCVHKTECRIKIGN